MNIVFPCPTCRIPASSNKEDPRDIKFVVAICNNSECNITNFYACTICNSKNTSTTYQWLYNHRNKNQYHKSKSLEINEQNFCNSDSSLGTDEDHVGISDISFGGSNNNIDILYLINNISTVKEYLDHMENNSSPVDELMMRQLACDNEAYRDNLDYFIAVLRNKGANYIVHRALSDRPFDFDNRSNENSLHTILQTHLCLNMKDVDKNIYAAVVRHLQENPEQTMTERQKFQSDSDLASTSTNTNTNTDTNTSNNTVGDSNINQIEYGKLKHPLFIPSKGSDIDRYLIKGTNSIYKNLPIPSTKRTASGFMYVSLKESIVHLFLSENPPIPFIPLKSAIHANTNRGRKLLYEFSDNYNEGLPPNFFPVELYIWSDGFLAHQFSVKNDAAAHVCYATIGAPNGDHSGRHTVPIWLGPQKESAIEAEEALVKEINQLSLKTFPVYHRKLNRIVNVKVKHSVTTGKYLLQEVYIMF